MNEDPIEDKPRSSTEPKLTPKQDKFADNFSVTGNGTESARRAGYRGNDNQLGVQAWDNLHNPKILRAITERLHHMTPHVTKTLEEGMDATKSKSFLDKAGNVITTDPQPDHKSRLQYVALWFKMVSKCSIDCSEQVGEDAGVHEQELSVADRALTRYAAEADAELGKIEREHHPVEQNCSTTPASIETEPAETELPEKDRELADHDDGHGTDHPSGQCSSTLPTSIKAEPETNREVAGHDANQAADHQVKQRSSTMPVSVEAGPAETDGELHDHDGNGGSSEPPAGAANKARNS